jgi:uncharacterized protein YukE
MISRLRADQFYPIIYQQAKSMQNICSQCGQPSPAPVCQRCQADKRTLRLIVGVALIAILGIGAIGIVTYLATSSSAGRRASEPLNRRVDTTAPAAPVAEQPPSAPGVNRPAGGAAPASTLAVDAAIRYTNAINPLLADTRQQMSQVRLDLKEFLATVNRTKDPRETRRVIDSFRDQLKEREQRLSVLSSAIKAVSPPIQLDHEHQRLSLGIAKYLIAVQGYVQGLSAYSFPQISASETELEAADNEIKAAADDFQKRIDQLLAQ